MAEQTDLLKRILKEMEELKYWARLAGIPILRRAIQDNLRDDESKLVYELSNGDRSSREIAEQVKKTGRTLTHMTVTNMWKRWSAVGTVEPSERYQGRFRKVVSLESLGIDVPEIPKEGEQTNKGKETESQSQATGETQTQKVGEEDA